MSVYPGTQVSAFDSSTQQWRPAVVLTVDPLAECAEPCDSTTFLVCFLDTANQEQLHGTTCIRYAADTEPTVCRCFKKFGCRRPECACYIEHKGNSSFGVRTAITGEQYCHYCAAARAADKKEKKKIMPTPSRCGVPWGAWVIDRVYGARGGLHEAQPVFPLACRGPIKNV